MENEVLIVFAILFGASLVRSIVGFGDAMISMPLLSLMVAPQYASALVGLSAATLSLVILLQSWRSIRFTDVWRLIVASILGIPFGIFYLKLIPVSYFQLILGLLLLGHSIFQLLHPRFRGLEASLWAYPFGFVAGVFGAAYNTNGPPVIIYASVKGWDKSVFRATIQGYFLPIGVMVSLSHAMAGMWTDRVLLHYVYYLPLLAVAIITGTMLQSRIPSERFSRLILVLLFCIGLFLSARGMLGLAS